MELCSRLSVPIPLATASCYRVEVFRTEREGRLAAGLAVAGDSEIRDSLLRFPEAGISRARRTL